MTKNEHPTGGEFEPTQPSVVDHAAPERSACHTDSASSEFSIEFTDPRKNLKTMRLLNELMGTLLLQLMIDQDAL